MVKKINIKESNRTFLEVDKGYSRQVYQALDSDFKSEWDNKVDANYISDQVELWLYNTERFYREIYNNRRKAYSIAFEAMIDLFQDVVNRYGVKVRVTNEMAKQWLKKNGLDYKTVLEPVTARIEEDRIDNRKKTESFIREDVSNDDVEELVLYITNDGDLYRGIITANIENLKKKIKRGVYDAKLALKAWTNVADAGVKKYDKQYGSGKGSLTMLNKATRLEIAKELMDYYDDIVHEDTKNESFRRMSTRKNSIRRSGRRVSERFDANKKRYSQKDIKDLVRNGDAICIDNYSFDEANDLYDRGYDVIAVSKGTYGMNGALLRMRDTDELLAITTRNSILFQLV
jgi:hypothetical protein